MQTQHHLLQKCRNLLTTLLVAIFALIQLSPTAFALTNDQLNALDSGIYYFNTEAGDSTSCASGTGVSSTLPATVPEPHRSLFTQAAGAFKMNPQFLAAIFLTENGNVWKPFNTQWASSPVGASGPFQFMPATWDAYKTDGNHDGRADINNIYDAAYSAAKMLGRVTDTSTPLGSISTPYKPGTLLYYAAGYNWGTGNVELYTDPSSPVNAPGVPLETQYYVKNIFSLINTGFTKSGHPNYPDPVPTRGGKSVTATCQGGGVVAGSIIETATGLAWPSGDHGKDKSDATQAYQVAMPKYNGSIGDDEWSDCGVFTATVMIASGADKNYPKRGTTVQEAYLKNSPKYKIIPNVQDTSQLQPGDVLVYNGPIGGHTFIYIGHKTGFSGDSASASLHGHVPQASSAAGSFNYFNGPGGSFFAARLR